jgi:predicted ATP-dependent endonuclease of OLD family
VDNAAQNQSSVHISRIQVPDFRALRNIDITFETDLVPRIFPLGSLNGGGKSTLLQLIFVLLCFFRSRTSRRFLTNMLEGFPADKVLAKIDLIVEEEVISLEFCSHSIDQNYLDYLEDTGEFHGNDYILVDTEKDNKEELLNNNHFFICNYEKNNPREYMRLSCEINSLLYDLQEKPNKYKTDLIKLVKDKLGDSIFLAAPITQSFRFFAPSIRDLAFKAKSTSEYYQKIESSREHLSNFFAYDTIAVDVLIKAFLKVRDDDFRCVIDSDDYSNSHQNYQKMMQEIEMLLGDKKVKLDKDFNGISFLKEDVNGNTIKLYPEDLSHGELKRLSLFIWLKYNNIENSIVLIDEIEIALHPDWQYQIVRDLETWAPSNQYILATHSYELCHALTPAHVKEISPRLLNK